MDNRENNEHVRDECVEDLGFFHRIHGDWIEVVAAVLLALATVASLAFVRLELMKQTKVPTLVLLGDSFDKRERVQAF
ncbi:MAG: hypothetical protein L6427_01310 [Actinomycetia bacterium]|nr:hypothetical protein [Actinomycetes bacterium]